MTSGYYKHKVLGFFKTKPEEVLQSALDQAMTKHQAALNNQDLQQFNQAYLEFVQASGHSDPMIRAKARDYLENHFLRLKPGIDKVLPGQLQFDAQVLNRLSFAAHEIKTATKSLTR